MIHSCRNLTSGARSVTSLAGTVPFGDVWAAATCCSILSIESMLECT